MITVIGNRIKELRKAQGLTQKELASKLNLSLSSIAMYETNKSQPSPDVIVAVAKFFEVRTDYLLGLED